MASRSATAARIAIANGKSEASMAIIAKELGIEVPASPVGIPLRDPAIRAAYHAERVNAFLESVVTGLGITEPEPETPEPETSTEEEVETDDLEPLETEDDETEEDDTPAGEDLSTLTVVVLKERAKAASVHGYGSMNKAELVEALQAKS